ncbi:MAG: hypothetical protein K2X97_12530, partial [Mycobacteriaceae bacterium]|nr:hypothetical protein [Mycobacteriaceae bacterium]
MMKWESYISSFFAAKFLLTDIYSQREKKPSPKLSLYDMAFAVKTTWDQYLNGSTYYMASSHAEFLKKEIPNLAIAFENYKKSFSEPNADVSTVERNVARAILAIKNKVEPQKPYDIEKPCGGYHEDPYYCRAIKILKLIPRTEAELLALPKETLLSYNISLIQTFGEALPVEQTLRDVLCANSTRFVSKAKMDGLPARLEMPRLITGHEKDPYYQESCAFGKINSLFLASDDDEYEDFLDPQPVAFWLASFPAKTEIDFYIDPLTPLTDVRMNLSSGPTLELATKWWNRQILPEIMEFYKQYISNYKQALNDNFLSFI